MPRLASDDEEETRSAVSSQEPSPEPEPPKKLKGGKKKKEVQPTVEEDEDEDMVVEAKEEEDGDDDDDDEDGEDAEEGIYIVEKIINHILDEEGVLRFHVRWKGYPQMKDHTWEPEENLETAPEVLNEYIDNVGGREALAKVPRPKKRGRQSNGTPSSTKKAKKSSKEKNDDDDVKREKTDTPQRGTILPPGNWEDQVSSIDTMDAQVDGLYVLLTFKDGQRVRQPTSTVYKRCPQKMLKFYESHLSFKAPDSET